MFNAINEIITHPLPEDPGSVARPRRRSTIQRTGQPVRRHSYLKGREGTFWRPMPKRQARAILLAAERFELQTKRQRKGKHTGALGGVALEILRFMINILDQRTGRLEPSIAAMEKALCRSRDAIVRGLQALREHGFLDWLRRYEPTGKDHGPQVVQTNNAYRLSLPRRLAALVAKYYQAPPPPDDDAHRRETIARERQAYLDSLPLGEWARATIDAGDDPESARYAAALIGLADSYEAQRESVLPGDSKAQ